MRRPSRSGSRRYLFRRATETIETSPASEPRTSWTIEKARALYNIDGWGAGFFDIDARGHVVGLNTPQAPAYGAAPAPRGPAAGRPGSSAVTSRSAGAARR